MGSVWRDARTIPDLGQAMALWLEGRIPSWPGYARGCGPDDETRHLIPLLARLNRAGIVTTNSQPGFDGPGYDRARWRQKAWVEAIVDDRNPLLDRIRQAAQAGGMTVLDARFSGVHVITDRDGEPQTAIDKRAMRIQWTHEWRGIGRPALRELQHHGIRIALIDPAWGRDDRLWPLLAAA